MKATPKKGEREAFEAHIRSTWKVPASYIEWALTWRDGQYLDSRAADQWDGWQSRAASDTGEALDAARWRRLVNASELPFPVATIADDPENDCTLIYGRERLEALIDSYDEISDAASASLAGHPAGEGA